MSRPDVHRRLPIPMPNGQWVVIEIWTPTSEEDWTYLMAVLEAMKPGLVASVASPPNREASS